MLNQKTLKNNFFVHLQQLTLKIYAMKKIITNITVALKSAALGLFIAAFGMPLMAQTTCTLDPVFLASPKYGIWPDSATNFVSGQVGVAYAQNITIKVPLDTVQNPIKICFTRFELLVPPSYPNYNLPPGLTLTGNPANLKFPGNANSCAIISGTPTTAGTYTLHFQVDVYGTTILASQSCPTPVNPNTGSKISTENIDYYVINISPASAINDYQIVRNLSVFPQPAPQSIHLSFYSTQSDVVNFQLVDITGKMIMTKTIDAVVGENTRSINVENVDNGIYFYVLTDKNQNRISDKVIIQH